MSILLSILFPALSRSLVRLRSVVGLTQNNNTMARLSTQEEIEVVNNAISVIQTQQGTIANLREQLGSLPEQNEQLQAALAAADEADAQSDEALSSLKATLETLNQPE